MEEAEEGKEAPEVHAAGVEAAGTHAGPEAFGAAIEQAMDAEDTGGPKEVQHGGGGEAEEEHAEPMQTPTKGKGPMDVQLDTPERPAEELKPKRGAPQEGSK